MEVIIRWVDYILTSCPVWREGNEYDRSKALAKIAELQAVSGEFEAAIQTAKSVVDYYSRSQALAKIAELQVDSGDFGSAIDTIKIVPVERNVHLYKIIRAMICAGDKEQFKKTLISASHDLQTAYQVAGLLFKIYKEQSISLSQTIRQLTQSRSLLFSFESV